MKIAVGLAVISEVGEMEGNTREVRSRRIKKEVVGK